MVLVDTALGYHLVPRLLVLVSPWLAGNGEVWIVRIEERAEYLAELTHSNAVMMLAGS